MRGDQGKRGLAVVVVLGLAVGGMAGPVRADDEAASIAAELAALKAQLERMQQRVRELERKQAAAEARARTAEAAAAQARASAQTEASRATAARTEAATHAEAAKAAAVRAEAASTYVVTGGESKGSFKLPGLDTSITLGGYVKGDVIYSSISAGANSGSNLQLFNPDIPVGAEREDRSDITAFTARQSRIWIKTATPTGFGQAGTYVEGDFYGSGGTQTATNSYGFRLRHAYGSLGPFLAGQTWTTFMNADASPETVDFGGPVGRISVRQAQVRWTQPFAGGNWQFALENPETTLARLDGGRLTVLNPDNDRLPDIIGRVNLDTGIGRYSLALMARELRIDDAIARDSTWGGAVSLAGIVPTVGKDSVNFILNYGNALGRYQYARFPDAALTAEGKIDNTDQWGGFLAYRHFWRPNLRSSLVYSYAGAFNDTAVVGGSADTVYHSAHANLIWSPTASTNLGLEYIYGYRGLEDGDSGNLNRVQFGAQYIFW